MRIITGLYKGRHFDVPHTFKARPTTDFAKENIFNVLQSYMDFDGTDALDLFGGTGSITLELLSRGCRKVVCIESDRQHHAFIRQCVEKLHTDKALIIRNDVFRYMRKADRSFDFIFADPPYALPELPQIPDLIFQNHLLNDGGIFVFEHGKDHSFSEHKRFVEHRQYGSVNFSIFR